MSASDLAPHETLTLSAFTTEELEFLRQLFDSDITITLKTVQVVASVKTKIMEAVRIRSTPT